MSVLRASPVELACAPLLLASELPWEEDGEVGSDDRRRWDKMAVRERGIRGVQRESIVDVVNLVKAGSC
jgi:hypothetical protein